MAGLIGFYGLKSVEFRHHYGRFSSVIQEKMSGKEMRKGGGKHFKASDSIDFRITPVSWGAARGRDRFCHLLSRSNSGIERAFCSACSLVPNPGTAVILCLRWCTSPLPSPTSSSSSY
jgi:hypothetical protein